MTTTVCVDAMGGDERPEVVLEGIAQALAADSDLTVLVAGDEDVVVPFCASHDRARALVTTEVIGMGEHPTDAVRSKRDSSIVQGCLAVRHGDADRFFSAGSTGAVLTAATLNVGRLRGIKRPAIAFPFPSLSGRRSIVLDIGANADCRPEMIVQFANMGSAYARVIFGTAEPSVALLSHGTEDAKGSETVVSFHEALAESCPTFVGNCEGCDLLKGDYDVIVCDGFTGNVALKSLEGTAKFLVTRIKEAAASSKRFALGAGLLKPAIKRVASELSSGGTGGAILLGLKAPVVIGHGATSVDDVRDATLTTARFVRDGLVAKIADDVA